MSIFKVLMLLQLVVVFQLINVAQGQLKIGHYSKTCPKAESIVTSVVKEATIGDPRTPPILLRLHFHDCFVEGCEGSILIFDDESSENQALEHIGLQGFDKIDEAKQALEAQCPGVVSCADIVALAARDSVVLAGGPFYEVETGRKDSLVSNKAFARNMPDVNDPIETLKEKFQSKGLSEKELVLLSGAHTIGHVACFFMPKRLYNFTGRGDSRLNDSDPAINPAFLPTLQRQCPKDGNAGHLIPLDASTPQQFDDQIMRNIRNGTAVIASDARLYDDMTTRRVVDSYAAHVGRPSSFANDFTEAMVKMGRVGVKTAGIDGEIRRVCSKFN